MRFAASGVFTVRSRLSPVLLALLAAWWPSSARSDVRVESLAGAARFAVVGGASADVVVGATLTAQKGVLTVARGGRLVLGLPEGAGSVALAGGSVLKFVRGGLWLKLEVGALLLSVGRAAERRLRVAFGDGYVTPTGPACWSVVRDRSGQLAVAVLEGAVRVVARSVERSVAEGAQAVLRRGAPALSRVDLAELRAWWRQRAPALVTGPAASPLGAGAVGSAVGAAPASVRPTFGSLAGAGASLPPLALPATVALLLVLGLVTLGSGLSRSFAKLLRLFGVAERCPCCGEATREGVILSVPVSSDLHELKGLVAAYGSSWITDALWCSVEVEVRNLVEDGRSAERITLSYRRCPSCWEQRYVLAVAGRVMAEVESSEDLATEGLVAAERLKAFVE